MQLNKTTDYAVRIVLTLATKEKLTTAEEISKESGVTKPYTTKILNSLGKEKLVKMVRGVKGGYLLNKDPYEITLYDILKVTEKSMNVNQCLDSKDKCNLQSQEEFYCPVREFYQGLQKDVEEKLKSITIGKLNENKEKHSRLK